MKEFFKDYAQAYAQTLKVGVDFYKKHWLGSIIFSAAVGLVAFAPVYIAREVQEKKNEELYKKEVLRIYGPDLEDGEFKLKD